jgi:hypothetical protein
MDNTLSSYVRMVGGMYNIARILYTLSIIDTEDMNHVDRMMRAIYSEASLYEE